MKIFNLLLILLLLTACTPKEIKAPALPSLVSLTPQLSKGINTTEVKNILAGYSPTLKFTVENQDIWEYHQQVENPDDHSINEDRLILHFAGDKKLSDIALSNCLILDETPKTDPTKPETPCYQKHLFPFNINTTFDALKRLLIISNYQIKHSDVGIISANGINPIEGNKDKMMYLTVSVIFKALSQNETEVIMSASFSMSEKQSTWVQAGFAGVTLPVPLPFQKKEEWIGTGIVTPKFYMAFYDSLAHLISTEYCRFDPNHPLTPAVADTNKTNDLPVTNPANVIPAVIPTPAIPVNSNVSTINPANPIPATIPTPISPTRIIEPPVIQSKTTPAKPKIDGEFIQTGMLFTVREESVEVPNNEMADLTNQAHSIDYEAPVENLKKTAQKNHPQTVDNSQRPIDYEEPVVDEKKKIGLKKARKSSK